MDVVAYVFDADNVTDVIRSGKVIIRYAYGCQNYTNKDIGVIDGDDDVGDVENDTTSYLSGGKLMRCQPCGVNYVNNENVGKGVYVYVELHSNDIRSAHIISYRTVLRKLD